MLNSLTLKWRYNIMVFMNYEEAKALLNRYGQTHLLEYYGELDEAQKSRLLRDIASIDFSLLDKASNEEKQPVGELSSPDVLSLEEIKARAAEFESIGADAVKRGKIACVLLAGGQGTRLGFEGPKGTYDMGVTKPLYIFECQINNLKAAAQRVGAYPHLFIMTSDVNDAETRAFLYEKNYFGYPEGKVHFYIQDVVPAISTDGKILLEEKYKVALVPNGNGGWYSSLKGSDCWKTVVETGVEWLNVYAVDNVLQRSCDPVFIGATLQSRLPCGGKYVVKAEPEERVGVLCKENGRPAIVEYFEMPREKNYELDGNGEYKYRHGVILNYLFNIQNMDGCLGDNLPYHRALKKVAYMDGGKKVTPQEPNCYKLETLVVDIIKLTGGCLGFEVEREKEFAPVKNRTGVDSVDSARELLKLNGIEV